MKYKILSILLSLVILSCSNGDDENNEPSNQFAGMWELTELRMSVAQDNNLDGTFSANLLDEMDCLFATINLKEDFTFTRVVIGLDIKLIAEDTYMYTCTTTSTVSGTYSITQDGIDFSSGGDLFFEGNNLVFESGSPIPEFEKVIYSKLN